MKNFVQIIPCLMAVSILSGCEWQNSGYSPTPYKPNYQSFSKIISGKIMKNGQQATISVKVNANEVYEVYAENYNDGDADRISLYANGVKLGSYTIPAKRMGGRGWWVKPYNSPKYRFSSTNEDVVFVVHVDSADSWGTWPETLHGDVVVDTNTVSGLEMEEEI